MRKNLFKMDEKRAQLRHISSLFLSQNQISPEIDQNYSFYQFKQNQSKKVEF